jgi:hypothetical protein
MSYTLIILSIVFADTPRLDVGPSAPLDVRLQVYGYTGPLVVVPGFATEAGCLSAGKELHDQFARDQRIGWVEERGRRIEFDYKGAEVRYLCIEQK